MILDAKAIQKLKNVQVSAAEVAKLNEEYAQSSIFGFFQLRPKDNQKIELVSFLPHHPMRGIELTFEKSRGILDAIADNVEELGGSPQAADLKSWGFPKRSKDTDTYREDDVQAAFCLQQLRLDEQFDGIKLVAAEFLMAAENKRIDVLGIKGTTLFIFELKKSRKNGAYGQALRYKNELETNLGIYLELLKHYPNTDQKITVDSVQAVAVMPWAKNHRLAKPDDVAHWLYEIPSDHNFSRKLIFHKS